MAAEEGQLVSCHTKEFWEEQFGKVKGTNKLLVVDFTATWCPPCRMIAPIVAELAKKTPHVLFLKVDVDELKDVAAEFEIEAMPTFLFLREGKVVHKTVGALKDELHKKVEELGGAPAVATA